MPQYFVAIHHPDDFDPSTESEATVRDIDTLNEEMAALVAAGFKPQKSERQRQHCRWPRMDHFRRRPGHS